MSTTQTRVIAIAFIIFIGGPLIAHLAGLQPREVENRRDSERPPAQLAFALDEEYYASWTDYLYDNFPLRDAALAANRTLDDGLFLSSSERVARGSDGWLFLKDSFILPCESELTTNAAVERFVSGVDALALSTPTSVIIVPDKFDVYPEHLGGVAAQATCATRAADELDAALGIVDPAWFRPLRSRLRERKDEVDLYLRADTHWTDAGAVIAIGELFPDEFRSTDVATLGPVEWEGDLSRLSGVPRTELTERLLIERRGVTVTRSHTGAREDQRIKMYDAVAQPATSRLFPGTTVVIHDSFLEPGPTDHLLRSIAQFNEHTVFVHWSAVDDLGIEALAADADRLVIEVVQRMFSTRTAEVFR